MKRLLSGSLAALMLLTLTGCGMLAVETADYEDTVPTLVEEEQRVNLPAEDPEDAATPEDPADAENPPGEEAPPDAEDPEASKPGNAAEDNYGSDEDALPENGEYTTKEDVALYIHQYGHLPDNFITKKEAQDLGWPGGNLEPYAPGKCIGGSRFGNYEGLLPDADGRTYTECDIDTLGAKSRGAKRLVFSNDGLIYYTEDHYETFELLYGDEGDG